MKNVRVIKVLWMLATVVVGMACAGSDGTQGLHSLVEVTKESAGKNCEAGGQRIDVGGDTNDDGKLGAEEIESTKYVCSGSNGNDGIDGTNGANGLDGTDGANGADGVTALVKVSTEAPGVNCVNGGQRIDIGNDANGNSTLDKGEIDSTKYVCDGVGGADGANMLIDVTDEAPGLNCIDGGTLVEWGQDSNDDGTLDSGEVLGFGYVCDLAVGEGLVYMTDGTTRPAAFVPCGSGYVGECTADVARSACQAMGLRVASHASDGSDTITSLGTTTSCGSSISYYVTNRGMPSDACLVGISNLDWSSCCGSTEWRGNTVAFGLPGEVFGYVYNYSYYYYYYYYYYSYSEPGYNSSFPNVSGTTWGCSALDTPASNLGGCVTQYVACTP